SPSPSSKLMPSSKRRISRLGGDVAAAKSVLNQPPTRRDGWVNTGMSSTRSRTRMLGAICASDPEGNIAPISLVHERGDPPAHDGHRQDDDDRGRLGHRTKDGGTDQLDEVECRIHPDKLSTHRVRRELAGIPEDRRE